MWNYCQLYENMFRNEKALFIDRDGTLVREPADEQVDSFEKLSFVPGVFNCLRRIRQLTDYEFVMVSNQDGLGTPAFPEDTFWPVHRFILDTLAGEGITFDAIHIDRHFPEDNAPTRKPGTAMLTHYMEGEYDMVHSYVIGDRETDAQLARNLGCMSLILGDGMTWPDIARRVIGGERTAEVHRQTRETDVRVRLGLDGSGLCHVDTGLKFSTTCSNSLPTMARWTWTSKSTAILKSTNIIRWRTPLLCWVNVCFVALVTSVVSGAMALSYRWMTACVAWHLILAVGRGWFGTLSLCANALAMSPQKCSFIFQES